MEKINHIIKLASTTCNDSKVSELWMLSDTLRQLNASENLICAGICHGATLNERMTKNDLRKIAGVTGVLIVEDLSNPNLTLKDMTVEERLLTLVNNYVKSEVAYNKAYSEEPNAVKQKIDQIKKILNDFNEIKKSNFIELGISIEKLNEIINLTKQNTEKLENALKSYTFFKLSDYDIVSERSYYTAYDKAGNFVLSDDTRKDVERSLEDDYRDKVDRVFREDLSKNMLLTEER